MQENGLINLRHLIRVCGMEVERLDMKESPKETYHEVTHSFKEELIIPVVALTNTFDFFMYGSATKNVRTADGVQCIVEGYEEKHICELEEDIKKMYNMDAWAFIKRWHKRYDTLMTNMMFVKIWLKKDENRVE